MLARSYNSLGKFDEAAKAYEKLTALKPEDADLLVDYALALGMAQGQSLAGKPTELLNKALQLDPENSKALQLGGAAAFQTKDYKQAIVYWQRALQHEPPTSELGQALTQKIAEAKSLAGTASK
jgi:cytochrome c-type biogenesis protein CcmH